MADKVKIEWKIPYGFGLKKKKSQQVKLTKRQKKIGLANLEGAGLGFAIGTGLGGFGGMVVGVPLGTLTANVLAKKKYGKKRGRPLKYQMKGINRLLSTREQRVKYSRQQARLRGKK
jgi:hypothetical protein